MRINLLVSFFSHWISKTDYFFSYSLISFVILHIDQYLLFRAVLKNVTKPYNFFLSCCWSANSITFFEMPKKLEKKMFFFKTRLKHWIKWLKNDSEAHLDRFRHFFSILKIWWNGVMTRGNYLYFIWNFWNGNLQQFDKYINIFMIFQPLAGSTHTYIHTRCNYILRRESKWSAWFYGDQFF